MVLDSKKIKVVAAIDFGTSRSGYAYAFKDDKRVIGRYEWDKQPFPYIKTLTQSLYNSDRKLETWGYAALSRLAELRQAKNAKDYSFFPTFKMALRESCKRTDKGPIATANNGQEFPVINLVADYLHQLGGLLRKELDNATSGELKDHEILWCLTIPAIWKDEEKSFMRRAAIKAGLITGSDDDRERLLLVLEPEAAAIYCQEKDQAELEAGKRFMVIDCGGGTVDITVHEVSPHGGLDEVAEGSGGAYGSTCVDKEFREYLVTKLTAQALMRYEEEDPIGWLELMANWERKKCDFDPTTTATTYFEIPNRLYKILSKEHPQVLEQLADEQEGDDEKVHVSKETMQGFFEPILDGLVRKVKEQFARLDDRGCDILYVVGGFSTSPVLRQRIQKEFGSRIKVVMPSDPGAAIVQGAASFGVNPESIRSRRSHLTYGCQSCQPFDKNHDRNQKSNRQYLEDQGGWHIFNRFRSFVLAGESIGVNEVVTHSFNPVTADQTVINFKFYATRKQNPRYVDESEIEELGELDVDISSTVGTRDRPVEVSMNFGKTEIAVTAIDIKTGKTYNTALRFSSTYSIE
ncbi:MULTISPECIES: Hsp70 family protein [Nostocales]|uniref:Hsp70 family protein n=2 Tax=Aphanizomenonaceae TaxID=1892259 RepID=A0ACC7S5T3_DOLFA|nr:MULTISPECIES: Hsp70 family protein [Nostocales]ALB39589.1 chaperone protein [Anabaena sp. WA102]MBD2276864.1 HSP70 family protein [Aphanizomenon flos-aquae FACHB-1040]MBO1067176.1 HSP70 family protein [Anabaena sp. 54]MTJ43554.1 Hsp70 family protein [Dolichospermum flos-aquae UHCC 0037]